MGRGSCIARRNDRVAQAKKWNGTTKMVPRTNCPASWRAKGTAGATQPGFKWTQWLHRQNCMLIRCDYNSICVIHRLWKAVKGFENHQRLWKVVSRLSSANVNTHCSKKCTGIPHQQHALLLMFWLNERTMCCDYIKIIKIIKLWLSMTTCIKQAISQGVSCWEGPLESPGLALAARICGTDQDVQHLEM